MKLKEFKTMKSIPKQEKKYYLVYCRKSSESEDRQVASIPDQERVLKPIITEKNLPVLGETFGEAKSAKAPGRSVFDEMIEQIKSRNDIKGIVCWKLNRLTRNPVDTGTLQWLLQTGEIEEIVTPSKTYTDVDSDFIMAVEGAQANRFIRDLRDDTKRGIDSKIEKGFAPILAPPGYRNNIEKRQGEKDISPHPTYFSLMKKVFELALAGNLSIEELAQKSKDLGIKNSRNKPISKTQMSIILHNPFYTGKFIYGGQLYPGKHDPILTESEFDLLQEIISGRTHSRKQKHNFPLTGLIRCGECGRMITAEEKIKHYKNGTSQYFCYYHCAKHNRIFKCYQPYMPAKELENQVINFLGTIKLSSLFVDWAIKWLNEANKGQKEVREARYTALKASYEAVLAMIDNLLDLKISPENKDGSLITNKEYDDRRSKLLTEKTNTLDLLAKVDHHVDEWTELATKTFDFAATAQERFEKGSIEDKKTILRAVGSDLILKDRKLEIKPRTPFLHIKQALSEINHTDRIEPNEKVDNTLQRGDSHPQNLVWGG